MKWLAVLLLCLFATSVEAANRFAVCTTTCTWDNTSTAMWSTSTGGGTGASAPVSTDDVILDGATCVGGTTCTITVNANLSVLSLTMGACTASTTGCILDFSANNNNITVPTLSTTGTGVRTLKQGSGDWNISAAAGWNNAVRTNFTLTPGTSNTIFQAATSAGTFLNTSAGGVYGHITINGNASTGGYFGMSSVSLTIGTFDVLPPNLIQFPSSPSALTVTNAFNWVGTPTAPIKLQPFSGTANPVIITAPNTSTIQYGVFYAVTTTNALAATKSFSQGRNAGLLTINGAFAGGACILGGWLLWRDMPEHLNDNFPAWLEKAG